MTKEGRLLRGKENYEKGKFLDNQETKDYVSTMDKAPKEKPKETPKEKPKETPKEKPKETPKEVEDVKPNK